MLDRVAQKSRKRSLEQIILISHETTKERAMVFCHMPDVVAEDCIEVVPLAAQLVIPGNT